MPEPQVRQNLSVPILSPVATGITTLTTASLQVIGANSRRRKIQFINPNIAADITIWVCPSNLAATTGGGSIPVFPGGDLTIEDENVNCAWSAIAGGGSGRGLTILEYL